MKRKVLTSTAATMALLGTVAMAGAQQVPDRGGEPSVRERSPDKTLREQPTGPRQPGMDRPQTTDRPDKDRPKAAERPDKDRPKAAEQPDRSRPKAAERPDRDHPKAAEQPDRSGPKAAERPDKDHPKAAERPDRERPKTARPDVEQGGRGRVQLSEQQRSDVGARLRRSSTEKTRIRVDAKVGIRLPRSVRLHPLPSTILTVAPAYRGYSYVVLADDTIVVVDARNYVVVDVIPPMTREADLSLSPDQMRFIFQRVPKDRVAHVRVRLALGAEIPHDVTLRSFPGEVVERIPEVRPYRYVIADRDVAVIDPRDNAVVLVISE